MALIINRRSNVIYLQNKARGMRAVCSVTKIDELINLLNHARNFHLEDEAEPKKVKRAPSEGGSKASREAEAAAAAAAEEKAAKLKAKIKFDIELEEEGVSVKYKQLGYLTKLISETKRGRISFDTAAEALAVFGSSKSEKKNLAAAKASITGLVRTKRLVLEEDKLSLPKEGDLIPLKKTGTDEE